MPPNKPQRLPIPAVLSIAGSDPSGGAGIQADLKTFTAIGVYGGAVISSLTVQNTMGVRKVYPLPPEQVREQIEAVLADLSVSHIKIGMVGTISTAKVISEALADFHGEVIYDPVMRATSGKTLVEENASAALAEHLVARATVVTPNLPELLALTGHTNAEITEADATALLFRRFPLLKAVALTGGHNPEISDTITDQLFLRQKNNTTPIPFARCHPKISTANSHGTGCTFASAFAAYHQLTRDYLTAFESTVSFMAQLVHQSASYKIGNGNGPLLHHLFRTSST